MTYKGVVTSGGSRAGTVSHRFNSSAGDILAVLFSVEAQSPSALIISVSGASQAGYYGRTAFGYVESYSVGLAVFVCYGPATVNLNSIKPYAYAVAHYSGTLWPTIKLGTPIFWNNVSKGLAVTTPLPGGLFFVITGNTTWSAEWTWYPTFSGAVNFNLRNHDCFFTGGITGGGALTIIINQADSADILVLPVQVRSSMVAADVTFI